MREFLGGAKFVSGVDFEGSRAEKVAAISGVWSIRKREELQHYGFTGHQLVLPTNFVGLAFAYHFGNQTLKGLRMSLSTKFVLIRDGEEQKELIAAMVKKRWQAFPSAAMSGAVAAGSVILYLNDSIPIWSLLLASAIAVWFAFRYEKEAVDYEQNAKWQDRDYFTKCIQAASTTEELVEAGLDLREANFAPIFSSALHYDLYRKDVESTSIILT